MANTFANRTSHVVVGLGATMWIGGILGHVHEFVGAGPSLIVAGVLMRAFAIKLRRATEPRLRAHTNLDSSVEDLLVRMVDGGTGWHRFWQRLIAPPTGSLSRIDRCLRLESRDWLEKGAASTLRVLGTLERLGADHPFVRRTAGELEWAVDHGMLQLLRDAVQVDRFPDTLPVVTLEAAIVVRRLDQLADLVERAAVPSEKRAQTVPDPLLRAVEDFSLESLVQADRR